MPDNAMNEGTVRATERGANVVKEYFDGGLVRATLGLRPTSYFENGAYREIVNEFANSGIVGREHIVANSLMPVSSGGSGTRRIHPTRENDVYLDIGGPHDVSTLLPYPMNSLVRTGPPSSNLLTSTNANAKLYVWHAGHYSKLGIELKAAWKTSPPQQIAFPVTLSGLTWDQGVLKKGGVAVMQLTAPIAYDMDNEFTNRRAMTWDYVQIAGQWYLILNLPTAAQMSGWSRPLIDPTLTLQPDGTAGKDSEIENTTPDTNRATQVSADAICTSIGNQRRGIYEFDISSIPAGSVVSSAIFTLRCRVTLTGAATVDIHRLTQSWTEAGVTYNKYDGITNWATAGGDYDAVADGSNTQGAGGFVNGTDYDFTIASLVQEWVSGTSNLGLIAKINSTATASRGLAAHSSDAVTASNRPKLVVVYTQPGLLPKLMQFHNRRRQ